MTEKSVTACNVMDKIAANCDDILEFLQVVMVKALWVVAVPILLRMNKCVWVWFRLWSAHQLVSLYTPLATAPQDHTGLTGFLSNITTRLQNEESIRPVIAEQRGADRYTIG